MLPISVDITIITSENINELTEMSVALCSDGIISLSIISVRTSIKSSKKEPANPPSIITYGSSVNIIANANITAATANMTDDEKADLNQALADVKVSGKDISIEKAMDGFTTNTGTVDANRKTGEKLTLQIGDTADDFNKLSVKVKDMHSKALGIADLTIADQDGAAAAIQNIKDAINTVSSTRGDLGPIQNRLEHTQNNLSVMTENIQDAESTIRDTDVADEMMAYTKNNILIQSAQAMLAQANQVPQGVLQLLQ